MVNFRFCSSTIENGIFRVNAKVKINIIHRISIGENIRHSMRIKERTPYVNERENSTEEFWSFGNENLNFSFNENKVNLNFSFEMPYNIWCNTCGNHIGMGVRYNAEKTKIGNYFTTPIFQFRMKCHLCDGHFEIKTDPKVRREDAGNFVGFHFVQGARLRDCQWRTARRTTMGRGWQRTNRDAMWEIENFLFFFVNFNSNSFFFPATEEMKKLATDAMFKLEYDGKDQSKKVEKSGPDLTELEMQQSAWRDDYIINYVLRKNHRVKFGKDFAFFCCPDCSFLLKGSEKRRTSAERSRWSSEKTSLDRHSVTSNDTWRRTFIEIVSTRICSM